MSRGNHSASGCHSTVGNCNASGERNQPEAWRGAFNEAIEGGPSVAMPRGNHSPCPSAAGNGNAPAQGSQQPPASTLPFSVTDGGNTWRCGLCDFSISLRPVNQATPSSPSSNDPTPVVEFLRRFLPPCDSHEGNPEPSTR